MTKEQQRVAIAEWCGGRTGWWCPNCKEWVEPRYVTNDEHHDDPDCDCALEIAPDYCGSLDAMWTAEMKLCREDLRKYIFGALIQVVGNHTESYIATSEQRAEALCRTLWPERWVEMGVK